MATARGLDFTNVKDQDFNIKHLPPGDYKAKVMKVQDAKSKKTQNDMWVFTIAVTEGPGKGAKYPYYCTLDADSLWKIRQLWAAAGITIPKKRVKIDPEKVVGRAIGISLDDDEYDDKIRSKVQSCIPLSEVTDGDADDADEDDQETGAEAEDDDDEEEPAPALKAAKPPKATAAAPAAADDDDLEELEIDEL